MRVPEGGIVYTHVSCVRGRSMLCPACRRGARTGEQELARQQTAKGGCRALLYLWIYFRSQAGVVYILGTMVYRLRPTTPYAIVTRTVLGPLLEHHTRGDHFRSGNKLMSLRYLCDVRRCCWYRKSRVHAITVVPFTS